MAIVGGLITLEDARASIYGVGVTPAPTSAADADIERYVEAATPVIENITGPILAASHTQTFDGGTDALVLSVPFNAVTSVTESGVVVTDVFADGASGILRAGSVASPRSFVSGVGNITVVVTVGSATVPKNIQLAARELVRHWWQIGRQANRPGGAPAGDAAPDVMSGFAVPRRVTELCQPNIRLGGFA